MRSGVCIVSLRAHRVKGTSVCYIPDKEDMLFTSSHDGSIKVWDVSRTFSKGADIYILLDNDSECSMDKRPPVSTIIGHQSGVKVRSIC